MTYINKATKAQNSKFNKQSKKYDVPWPATVLLTKSVTSIQKYGAFQFRNSSQRQSPSINFHKTVQRQESYIYIYKKKLGLSSLCLGLHQVTGSNNKELLKKRKVYQIFTVYTLHPCVSTRHF